jgi:hypothetical protein
MKLAIFNALSSADLGSSMNVKVLFFSGDPELSMDVF